MKRRVHTDKEHDLLQKLKRENDKLKKQIGALRKQLARIDLDDYNNVKELLDKYYYEDKLEEREDILEKLKDEWKCLQCGTGYLEIVLYTKQGNPWYFRKCTTCSNRTKAQKHNPNVKGVLKGEKY